MKSILLLVLVLLLFCFASGEKCIFASEGPTKLGHSIKRNTIKNNIDSCTERCHVNYMAYENKFGPPKRVEIFKHETHSLTQDLDCVSCHDDKEVNTKGHGKLTIQQKDCLKCHHVEVENSPCKRCHTNIDENPMKYKKEMFIHGFTVESDVDCGLCHIKNPHASMKDKIDCIKCHHTTPYLNCAKCHKEDIAPPFITDPKRKDTLSWTVAFNHSQHPEQELSCERCHEVTHDNDAGIVEYNINCSKCHHVSEVLRECSKCHEEPTAYLKGEIDVEGIGPMPDTMSRAVKCEDCHKFDEEKSKFKGVKDSCVECHNNHYGKLYDAWNDTIKNRLNMFNSQISSIFEEGQMINQPELGPFMEETGKTINLITKYGIHNFNMTRSVMDYLENKTSTIMGLEE